MVFRKPVTILTAIASSTPQAGCVVAPSTARRDGSGLA